MSGAESFEYLMGLHAAPMLAGPKPASLVSFRKSRFEDFDALLESYKVCFDCKGISFCCLAEGEEYILLLFYRACAMEACLASKKVRDLLAHYGYGGMASLEEMLSELKRRMQKRMTFPHEIGLFLGYPPEDVRGFIENAGQCFAFSGYWKVYANEEETRRLFDFYKDCTHEFCRKLGEGMRFSEILQAG